MKTGHRDKMKRVVCITALLVLISCPGIPQLEAEAFRQVQPPVRTPHPVPPPHVDQDPSFYKWSSPEVFKKFKESGLEAVIQKGLTTGAPSAEESTIFFIPSAGENIGGLISSYRSKKALNKDTMYYSRMNRPFLAPAWRVFRRENILLLISGKVSKETALEYKKVLNEM